MPERSSENHSDFEPVVDKSTRNPQADRETRRRYLFDHIESYLSAGVSVDRLAEILGAENLLQVISSHSSTASNVKRFDIQSYVEEKLKSSMQLRLPDYIRPATGVIVPPDRGELIQPGSGKGVEKKGVVPRSDALVALLSELDVPYGVQDGRNTDDMMRNRSYLAYYIHNPSQPDSIRKLVLINNEVGNVTFVVHSIPGGTSPADYLLMTKEELRARPEVTTLRYPGNLADWSTNMREQLSSTEPPEKRERSLSRTENQDVELAKEGWLSSYGWAQQFTDRSHPWIIKQLAEIVIEHPDWWTEKARGTSGQDLPHYSPDVLPELQRRANAKEIAKGEMLTAADIQRALNKSNTWVTPRLEVLVSAEPTLEQKEHGVSGTTGPLYKPEVLAELRKQIEVLSPPAKKGWLTFLQLRKRLFRADYWLTPKLDDILASHPEWCEKATTRRGKEAICYSPKVYTELLRQRDSVKPTKENWLRVGQIETALKKGNRWVKRNIEVIVTNHPDWVEDSLDAKHRSFPSYSPEVLTTLQHIKEEGQKRKNRE
ncbi:MAG: hypothetical protein WC817_05325 [Patescibacteria group bacterium]|jgi:hypothetical protein